MKSIKPLPVFAIASLVLGIVTLIVSSNHPEGRKSATPPVRDSEISRHHAQDPTSVVQRSGPFRMPDRAADTVNQAEDQARSDSPLHTLLSNPFPAPTGKVFSGDTAKVVRNVVSEAWLDPEDKTVRRRIRVVEADFKYPSLRLEEDVSWNAETSRYESTLRTASVADHLMVKPAPGQDTGVVMERLRNLGFPVRSDSGGLLLLEIPGSTDPTAQLDAIQTLEALENFIDFAEPDYLVFPCAAPNDPLYAGGHQWSLENNTDSADSLSDADIDAEEGWSVRTSASDITVAVLDTGVRYTHEDLVNRMWQDASGNFGWDAYDDDTDPMDVDGHGTHCAGIVGAQGNNGVGIAGVAWDVRLMAVRFIGTFGGTTSDAIRSMNFARENGADIISASWGGSGYSRGLLAAIEACYAADIPVVTAAGNERWDIDSKPQYPASYPTPNIVTVAATSRTDRLTTFSNYGYTAIDLAAPGKDILSCGIASDSDYRYLSGTSAATPHVAGALALAKAHHGAEPVDNLIIRLLRSVDLVDALADEVAYGGRLNLNQLLLSSTTGYSHDFFNTPFVFKYCSGYWCRKNGSLTREPDEDSYSPDTGNRSAWFRWTAPGDGLARFTGTAYQGGDVSVVAFEGTVRNSLRRIKDNFAARPTDPAEPSVLHFYVEKDKAYTFSVDSRSSVNQVIAARINFTPGNDMLSEAVSIPTGKSFQVEGNNCSASIEPFEYALPHQNLVQQNSVWWKWTPSESGEYVISTLGSNFDTVLGVYTRNSGSFQTIGVNDSRSLTDDTSRLELNLTGGQEYHIVVASYHKDTVGEVSLAGFPKEAIRFLQQPESQLVRFGDSFELSVIADASSEATYEWFGPQGAVGSVGNGPSIIIPSAGPNDMGDYYVIVRDGESSGTSATATITELALPPRFLHSPQDISTLDGSPVQMYAKADGLEPVTYTWFKEGDKIGTGNIYTIASASPADSGIYYVEASNPVGTTRSHPFQVLVSTDTFGPFIYRNPATPSSFNSKFINGEHFGFGIKGELVISSNGINWETPIMLDPIDIKDIAYETTLGLYIMVGEPLSGAANTATAVSLNSRNWSTNPDNLPAYTHMDGVVAGNGIFVGHSSFVANTVMTTTNGVDWTQRQYTPGGQEASNYLQRMVFYNGEFIGGGKGKIFRSSDGINWSENATPNDGYLHVHNNQLVTFTGSPSSVSTSTDGINWSAPVPCVSPPSNLTKISSNGDRFYHAVGTTVSTSLDGINWEHIEYDLQSSHPYGSPDLSTMSGPEGNLVAMGGSTAVSGPSHTELRSIRQRETFPLPPITKIFGNTIYRLEENSYSVTYSNDMINWHSNSISDRYQFKGDTLIKAQGSYWAIGRPYLAGQYTLMTGPSPAALDPHPQVTHDTSIFHIHTWNDDIYAVNNDVVFKLDGSFIWQTIYTMPKTLDALEKIRGIKSVGRGMIIWSNKGAVYGTLNGTTWTRLQHDAPGWIAVNMENLPRLSDYAGPSLCEFDGKLYLYVAGSNRLYVADAGFNFTEQLNLNPFSRMTVVPEGLLGIEDETGWFSPDGTTWQQFPTYYRTNFFRHYNGTLLAETQYDLYQAGIPASTAPVNNASGLVETQSIATGSLFDLDYTVTDAEERFDHVEFYLNGVLVGQSTNAAGTQTFNVNWAGKRTIEMRSYDQDGQISSNFWTLEGLTTKPDTLINTTTSSFDTVWDGRFQRSIDQQIFAKTGDVWVGRRIPFSIVRTEFVFTPDAIFANAYPNTVRMSRNGMDWISLNYTAETLKYEDGWLLAQNIKPNGESNSRVGVSKDGVNWRMGGNGNLSIAAGNGVIVAIDGLGWNMSELYTSSDGMVWAAGAEMPAYNVQFVDGAFHGVGDTMYVRSTDGRNWTDLTPPLADGEEIDYIDAAGGWLYLISGGFNVSYKWISQDNGTTWEKVTDPNHPLGRVRYENGIWFSSDTEGTYASTDGLDWQISIPRGGTEQDQLPYNNGSSSGRMIGHEGGVTVQVDNGHWTTRDGFNWEKEDLPVSNSSSKLLTEPIIINASTYLTRKGGKLFVSEDGSNWFESPFAPPSGQGIQRITTVNNRILVYTGGWSGSLRLFESTDGLTFSEATMNGSYNFAGFKSDGVQLFGKANNTYLTSADGANWTALTTPASIWANIELLNGTFIIIEPRVAGNPGYQDIHHSQDGIAWQTTRLTNANITTMAYGNGFFIANFNSSQLWKGASIDALALTPTNQGGGFTFVNGTFYLKTTSGIWSSADGENWQQLYSSLTEDLEVISNKIYLSTNSSLRPLIAADLQVTGISGAPANLAVGANLNATFSVRNVGMLPIPAGTNITVRGVLTRDGIFGNDDDVYAGIDEVVIGSELAVGASADLNSSFRIPGLRAGGQFKLILVADPEISELTRTNNMGMTDSTILTVDEFVLNINRNGDGNVSQDFAALRYANGTLVTLSANAAKGSGFGGWSGNSVSPLSQITVMMNQNQNLTANFMASATLQLAIAGHGAVTGWESPGSYAIGATASLTAQPDAGWEFARWAGGSTSTNSSINLTVNQNTNLTAIFRQTLNGWKGVRFSVAELADPSISGDHMDPDLDGIPNWQEYLHGSNPKDSRSKGVLQKGLGGGFLQVIYTRNTGAEAPYALTCEGSRNLVDWNAADFEQRVLSVNNGIETIEARMSSNASINPNGFIRIRYVEP